MYISNDKLSSLNMRRTGYGYERETLNENLHLN